MLILPDDYEVVIENIELALPDAESRLKQLSEALDKADINIIVENMVAAGEFESAIALGSLNEEMQLNEFIVKQVSSKGEVTRRKDRKTRARQAFQTTGLSKAKRRAIARKVVRTKKANPSSTVRGTRKRKKAMKRRKALGLS